MPIFNLLKFPDRASHGKDIILTMLTDILPTGFHGAVMAVKPGSVVYIAGAGQ
jgi:glutathione-independent formaldehyde dehydrogenase